MVPQLLGVVGPLKCTVCTEPAGMLPKLQSNVPLLIEHAALSWLQVIPLGSGSVSVTFADGPGPSAVTASVNLALSPALMLPLSALLTTLASAVMRLQETSQSSGP